MSYELYKVIHVTAALLLFLSVGAILWSGSRHAGERPRLALVLHGIAMGVIVIAGFGLLARLGAMHPVPGWAWAKLGVWLLLGVSPVVLRRSSRTAGLGWVVIPVLGAAAVWLAVTKPF